MQLIEEYANTWTSTPTQYTHGARIDEIVIKQTATAAQYYHQDGLNSLVAITSNTGTTDATQKFNAWGNINTATGAAQYFGYTGREKDETGLMYYRARYYAPDIGRFTQQDPIGLSGGLNAYAYVNNSPAMFNDPSGKDCRSSGGMTTCTPPYDGAPTVSYPTPPGFPTNITGDSQNHHGYNIPVTANNIDPNLLRQGLIDNPTPGYPNAATIDGTMNDATPNECCYHLMLIAGGYESSPAISYIRQDGNGNMIIVNVTQPGHPLYPGYVVRTVTDNGDGSVTVNNYGEGTGELQSDSSMFSDWINNNWIGQTQRIIDDVRKGKGSFKKGGFVINAGIP